MPGDEDMSRFKIPAYWRCPHGMDWPHAPVHRLTEAGVYIVTGGTYRKEHFFREPARLTLLRDELLSLACHYGWRLHAWAVFSNHYHLVGAAPESGVTLPRFLGHLHTKTATAINRLDSEPGRRVWFQFWDTHITFQKSYLARLHYVHNNPVKHGLVEVATNYPWCSASWFETTAAPSFRRTVGALNSDQVNVIDDFTPE